jgi:hypothetical protein
MRAEMRTAIAQIEDVTNAIRNIRGDRAVPHRIFEVYPRSDSRALELSLVRTVSQWAFDELMIEVERRNADSAEKFYRSILANAHAAPLRGRMWEHQVHKYLRSDSKPTSFTAFYLDDRKKTVQISFPPSMQHKDFGDVQTFQGLLASAVGQDVSCYMKPVAKNFATIDSVLFAHDFTEPGILPLISVQITDALKHPCKVRAFKTLQTSLKSQIPQLASLRPSVAKKWILVFIVPSPMASSFTKQTFDDVATKTIWDSKVVQYVLELDKDEVWKA